MEATPIVEYRNATTRLRMYHLECTLAVLLLIGGFMLIPALLALFIRSWNAVHVSLLDCIPVLGVFALIAGCRKALKRIQINYQERQVTVEYIWLVSPVRRWVVPFEHLQTEVMWKEGMPDEIARLERFDSIGPLISISEGKMGLPADQLRELHEKLTAIATAGSTEVPSINPRK